MTIEGFSWAPYSLSDELLSCGLVRCLDDAVLTMAF